MKFYKVNIYPSSRFQWTEQRMHNYSVETRGRLAQLSKVTTVYLAEDEIASLKEANIRAIDEEVCHPNCESALMLNDCPHIGAVEFKEDFKLDRQSKSCIKTVRAGVVMLKHGIATNLGLNGTDYDQMMLLTPESFSSLVTALECSTVYCTNKG